MTFDEAKALICRINPDSNDPLVQCAITICRAQAEALKAHWCIGGADEAAPPNPAIAGPCLISEDMAARLMREVKRGADAAERAEKAATETLGKTSVCIDTLSGRDRRNIARASKTRDPLLNAKDHAVYEKWNEFSTGEADPELPDGTFRRASGRRDFDEFFAACQNEIVFNGKTLGELYPDDGGGVESMRQAIERERKRRARAEESAKATPPCPPPPKWRR